MAEIVHERRITVQQLPDTDLISAVERQSHIDKHWDGKTPYIKLNGIYFRLNSGHKLPQLVDVSKVTVIVYKDSHSVT